MALSVWEGALFYVSVKRSPCAFGFCVRLVCAGCLRGKKGFCFFWPSKERNISACAACAFLLLVLTPTTYDLPAHCRGGGGVMIAARNMMQGTF
jgi:hypothetical protein